MHICLTKQYVYSVAMHPSLLHTHFCMHTLFIVSQHGPQEAPVFSHTSKCVNIVFVGEKPHQCDICKKRFSSTSNLKTHLRLHSGQKPYACDLCPAKFTQFVHLKLHKRLHTNERPYTCQGCSKKYISASGLRCVSMLPMLLNKLMSLVTVASK